MSRRVLGALCGAVAATAVSAALFAGGVAHAGSSPAVTPESGGVRIAQDWRTLQPFADEYVPAYTCPADYPYLRQQDYEPLGTTVMAGVQLERPAHVGVSITGHTTVTVDGTKVVNGTATGFPNSSAMNYSFYPSSYRVVLHCTDQVGLGYRVW